MDKDEMRKEERDRKHEQDNKGEWLKYAGLGGKERDWARRLKEGEFVSTEELDEDDRKGT